MTFSKLWKTFLNIDWSRVLRPLPTLAFVVGISITIWVSRVVQDREQENADRQSAQRATDIVDRTVLLVFNSILRIQSYDELFELSGSKIRYQMPTLKRALRRTIFKRLSIFELTKKKSPEDQLPELRKIQLIEAAPSTLPNNGYKVMRSEHLRAAVAKLLKTDSTHQMVVHERQGIVILSVVWRASSNLKAFYLYSTPIVDFFEPGDLSPGEKLLVTDPLTNRQWVLLSDGNRIKAVLSDSSEAFHVSKGTSLASLDPAELNNKLDLKYIAGPSQVLIPLYLVTLLGGLLATFFTTYLFWILLSQNRRISSLVIDKTTDLENANHDLHEALAARSRFLANVSHEIRTPLNLILGMIELCNDSAVDEKQRNYLKSMGTAGNHLLGMVEDILDLSRPEFHSVDIKFRAIGLVQFLEEIGRIMTPLCAEKNLKFHLVLATDLPSRLRTDPSRLRQILINLLRNSTKYIREGYVLLRVSRLPDSASGQEALRFEVEDSGVGIPKDRINQVFDAFFQIQGSKILSGGGVGLGLSIVKDLVRKLNGKIEVSSTEGVGSNFRIDMIFEPLEAEPWLSAYEAAEGTKYIYVISKDSHFIESLAFLKFFPDVEISIIENLEFTTAVADLLCAPSSAVILDASVPPSKDLQNFLSRLGLDRLIFVGDRRGSIRPEGSSKIIKIDANPAFPTLVLSTLGYSSKLRRVKDEEVAPSVEAKFDEELSSVSIVVADDDSGNRELFAAYLESFSSDVRFAADGQEALDLCRQTRPDFLIADLRMPVMDGFTLIKKIREEEKDKNLPPMKILLITADALEETAEKAKATSANLYLTKPIRKATLLDAIRSL
jgi:signal transduction histidine kinase/ActR/RegA family two-component response regulator